MLPFCGQEKCSIDENGRVKLSPRLIGNFLEQGEGDVVLHCAPEGAIAVYPESVFLEMRRNDSRLADRGTSSVVYRRNQRYFGAMSHSQKISQQGRITIPEMFREFAALVPGKEAVVVGLEVGIEIWNKERWDGEMMKIQQHSQEKAEREMAADLLGRE